MIRIDAPEQDYRRVLIDIITRQMPALPKYDANELEKRSTLALEDIVRAITDAKVTPCA